MVKLDAHFDGKVIVPDEPLALMPNQKLRITIETSEIDTPKRTDFAEWIGLIPDGRHRPHDPADEDALWENVPLQNSSDCNA